VLTLHFKILEEKVSFSVTV